MDEENVDVPQPTKRGKPSLLDLDPNMSYSDYRKIFQNHYYEANPREKMEKKVLTAAEKGK